MGKRGNGEGSIFPIRKNGEVVGYRAAVKLDSGKRKYLRGRTREDVAKDMAKLLGDKAAGKTIPVGRQTLGVFLAGWLGRIKVRASTHESYTILVNHHIIPAFGKKDLAKLAPADVQKFLDTKLVEVNAKTK